MRPEHIIVLQMFETLRRKSAWNVEKYKIHYVHDPDPESTVPLNSTGFVTLTFYWTNQKIENDFLKKIS